MLVLSGCCLSVGVDVVSTFFDGVVGVVGVGVEVVGVLDGVMIVVVVVVVDGFWKNPGGDLFVFVVSFIKSSVACSILPLVSPSAVLACALVKPISCNKRTFSAMEGCFFGVCVEGDVV